jgi:hypothetical protein
MMWLTSSATPSAVGWSVSEWANLGNGAPSPEFALGSHAFCGCLPHRGVPFFTGTISPLPPGAIISTPAHALRLTQESCPGATLLVWVSAARYPKRTKPGSSPLNRGDVPLSQKWGSRHPPAWHAPPQRQERRMLMDPATIFCPNLACPARGQTGQGHSRIHSRKD